MNKKKLIRSSFRDAVFNRDNNKCRVCNELDEFMDAHHIKNRDEIVYGGYVRENGISLCIGCHLKAEQEYSATIILHPNYTADKLYELIGSSYEEAVKASERLKDV